MTDGIIQKVFKKYDVMNENYVWLLDMIQQELIEEIKNYELFCEKDNGRKTLYVMKRSLIGDNE